MAVEARGISWESDRFFGIPISFITLRIFFKLLENIYIINTNKIVKFTFKATITTLNHSYYLILLCNFCIRICIFMIHYIKDKNTKKIIQL